MRRGGSRNSDVFLLAASISTSAPAHLFRAGVIFTFFRRTAETLADLNFWVVRFNRSLDRRPSNSLVERPFELPFDAAGKRPRSLRRADTCFTAPRPSFFAAL